MVKPHKELTVGTKKAIVKLNNSGVSQAEISRRLDIPRTTITDILKRFRRRGNVENTHRSGAPSKLSRLDTRGLSRLVRKTRRKSLVDITHLFNQNRDSTVSYRTV